MADRDDARGRVTAVPQPTDIRRPIRRQGIVELSRIIARWPVVHQQGGWNGAPTRDAPLQTG